MNFFKVTWIIIKDDLFNFINEFFFAGYLPKAFTYSFIALIPKNSNPQDLNAYHLICLIGSVYRIISKILVGENEKCNWKPHFSQPVIFRFKSKYDG